MVPAAASASQETRKRPSTFIVQYALPTQKWPDGSFGAFLLRHGERGRASGTRPLIASSPLSLSHKKKKKKWSQHRNGGQHMRHTTPSYGPGQSQPPGRNSAFPQLLSPADFPAPPVDDRFC